MLLGTSGKSGIESGFDSSNKDFSSSSISSMPSSAKNTTCLDLGDIQLGHYHCQLTQNSERFKVDVDFL